MTWGATVTAIVIALGASTAASSQTGDAESIHRTNEKIQFDRYPPESMRRGEEGIVGVKVMTDRKGGLTGCRVTQTSGYLALDQASCDMLLLYGKGKPYLSPDGRRIVREQDGQVFWQLPPDKRPATPPPKTVTAAFLAANQSSQQRMICRTQVRIGSLAAREKTCMTAAEWERQRHIAQDDLQSMTPKFQSGQ